MKGPSTRKETLLVGSNIALSLADSAIVESPFTGSSWWAVRDTSWLSRSRHRLDRDAGIRAFVVGADTADTVAQVAGEILWCLGVQRRRDSKGRCYEHPRADEADDRQGANGRFEPRGDVGLLEAGVCPRGALVCREETQPNHGDHEYGPEQRVRDHGHLVAGAVEEDRKSTR